MLIKNGLVLNPTASNTLEDILDLRIENNRITQISTNLKPDSHETIIDATNLWVCPGFIDIHCHLRDLKQNVSEDILSGTTAAASGGYTTVVSMANTSPPIDNILALKDYKKLIAENALIEVLPLASLTKNLESNELVEIYNLAQNDVIGFSDDGNPFTNKGLLYKALLLTKNLNKLIISHPEDKNISSNGVMNQGAKSFNLGLAGIPQCSESSCIASEIELVRETDSCIHFSHVSLAASIKLIHQAKSDGLKVTCDVTPHHLALSEDNITNYNTSFKMNPPLRNSFDQMAIIKGIETGIVDAIGTDHAPHSSSLKCCTFSDAAFGVTGLETAFSLVYEKMYLSNLISKLRLISLFTSAPAKILNIDSGNLSIGKLANLTLIDPNQNWDLNKYKTHSKSKNSPFYNLELKGKVMQTIFQGNCVYQLTI